MSGFIFSDPVFRAFVLLVFGFDLFRFSFGILRIGWPTFCDPAMFQTFFFLPILRPGD